VKYEFEAAWIPDSPDREPDAAAVIAIAWAERAALARRSPAVLVTDQINEYHGRELFAPYRRGRHVSPKSRGLDFRPGAVIAHRPTPKALDLSMRLANGAALVVVEHPFPWHLEGWASAVGAQNLLNRETLSLDPTLARHLEQLIFYGNNGYLPGFGQDRAQSVLADIQTDGLLNRDIVVSALAGLGVSASSQERVAAMIDRTSTQGRRASVQGR
jgi:hypothetical protein